MAIHHEVLAAAQRLCAERSTAEFTPDEIVRALPHINAQSIRTHVTSRCCVNAAPHHQSRLDYFRKIGRGRYELLPRYRTRPPRPLKKAQRLHADRGSDVIHAVVTRSEGRYVASCHEIAVVTQGRTLDETMAGLSEAIALHLEGEDLSELGLAPIRAIHISYELTTVDAA